MAGIACVVLVAFVNFAAYPYIRPAIDRVDTASTPWLLLLWGVGGVAGTVVAGAWRVGCGAGGGDSDAARRRPRAHRFGIIGTGGGACDRAVGLRVDMVPVFTQLWVTRVEPTRAESAVSLQVTAFQVAITVGSAAGGALLDGYGVRAPLLVGAAAACAAGLGWAGLRIPADEDRRDSCGGIPVVVRRERPLKAATEPYPTSKAIRVIGMKSVPACGPRAWRTSRRHCIGLRRRRAGPAR